MWQVIQQFFVNTRSRPLISGALTRQKLRPKAGREHR